MISFSPINANVYIFIIKQEKNFNNIDVYIDNFILESKKLKILKQLKDQLIKKFKNFFLRKLKQSLNGRL